MIVPDQRPPLHVVLLGVWLGFPLGMAATSRARLLALALRDGGVDVRVICARAVDPADGDANKHASGSWRGIPFEYPGGVSRRSPSFARRRLDDAWATVCTVLRLASLKSQDRLDCVYLYVAGQRWTPVASVLDALLRTLHVPVVLELNELPWSLWKDRSLLQRLRHPLAGTTGVVAISGYLATWARREAVRRHQTLEVVKVPILVDVDEEAPAAPDAAAPPAVLFAGDVSAQNLDILRLIGAALEDVWRVRPDCRFICVGADGGDARLAGVLPRGPGGLDERIELPGFVPRADLLALYRRASALLLPLPADLTSTARFPTKLGEYLVSRRPVITTDVGEVGTYLKDGESAFVVPPGDMAAFAAAILEVLGDPERAAQVAEAGDRVAREEFHYARHSRALAEMVGRCAGKVRT